MPATVQPRLPSHQQSVNAYFDRAAGFWNDIYESADVYAVVHQQRRQRVLDWIDDLGLPAAAAVLEIGCGAGHTAVALASRGFTVDAIDGAAAMLDQTRQRAESAGLGDRLRAVPGNVHALEYDEGRFDLVLALGVLPWLDDIRQPLAEMARVLKPGGFLIVTMDNRWAWHRVLEPRVTPWIMPFKTRAANWLTRLGALEPAARAVTLPIRTVDHEVRRVGLRKIRWGTLGFGPFTWMKLPLLSHRSGVAWHRKLQKLADDGVPGIRSGGGQYLVLAQKEGNQ